MALPAPPGTIFWSRLRHHVRGGPSQPQSARPMGALALRHRCVVTVGGDVLWGGGERCPALVEHRRLSIPARRNHEAVFAHHGRRLSRPTTYSAPFQTRVLGFGVRGGTCVADRATAGSGYFFADRKLG